jgi:putative copper export protein
MTGLAACAGVVACRLWFFTPLMQREASYRGKAVSVLWNLFFFALGLLIAGSAAGLVVRSVKMSGQPLSGISSVLPLVLFKTHYGTVWLVRIGSLILLAISGAFTRYRDTRASLVFMMILSLSVAMTASASGHGADAGDFSIPELVDWLHLIAACLWGGGLMVLVMSVLPGLTGNGKGSPVLLSRVADRFSAMAGISVAVIVVTAIYNFYLDVGSPDPMMKSPYGLAVSAKILLLLLLINIGAFNRYVSVPMLRKLAGRETEMGRDSIAARFFTPFRRAGNSLVVARRFRLLVGLETLLILAALFCAAILRNEIPASHAARMTGHHEMGASHQRDDGGMNMK